MAPNLDFKGTPSLDVEFFLNISEAVEKTYSYTGILTGT